MSKRYDTIHASMDATIQSIRGLNRDHKAQRRESGMELAMFLREFKTMGFHMPRQTGATTWLMRQFAQEPHAWFATRNDLRKFQITNYDRSGNLRYHANQSGPEMTDDQKKRIVTQLDMGFFIPGSTHPKGPVKLFILDDASIVFDKVRITKFYEWLAECEGVDEDTIIIRMN